MSAKHNHEQHQEKQPIMSHDKMNHMNHDMAHEQMAMSHQHEGMKGIEKVIENPSLVKEQ